MIQKHLFHLELSVAVFNKSQRTLDRKARQKSHYQSPEYASCCLLPGCIPAGEMISALSHLPGITQAAIKQMIAKVRSNNNVNNLSLSKAEKNVSLKLKQ